MPPSAFARAADACLVSSAASSDRGSLGTRARLICTNRPADTHAASASNVPVIASPVR